MRGIIVAALLLGFGTGAPAQPVLQEALEQPSTRETGSASPWYLLEEANTTVPAPHQKSPSPYLFSVPRTGLEGDYFPRYIILNDELPYRYRELIGDSVYLQVLLLSSIGVLALMPESVTHWSRDKLEEQTLWERWDENVFDGPVWDKDDWTINYIGHPVSGAFYYTMARNDGMSVAESAAFSALMSTFFWEYGYEAFAEVPSIQDLIVTPLAGSILGEGMIILQHRIDDNGGLVMGSKTLGNVAYFLIDPLGNIAAAMRDFLRRFGIRSVVTMSIRTYPMAAGLPDFAFRTTPEYSNLYGEREYGFVITFY